MLIVYNYSMGLVSVFSKKFVAIDNSTNSCAWSIWEGNKLLDFGEITFRGKDTYERLVNVNEALAPLRKVCTSINDLYIESAAFVNSRSVVILLALAEGAVISSISHGGMRVHRIGAMTWQRSIGNPTWTKSDKAKLKRDNPGKTAGWYKTEERRLRKQKTMDIVERELGVRPANDNQGDSLGLGLHVARNK